MREMTEGERYQLAGRVGRARSGETLMRVWRFVHGYIEEHGFPPSQKEIAQGCFISRSYVPVFLDRLESWGVLERRWHKSRAIHLIVRPPDTDPPVNPSLPVEAV